MFLPPWGAHLPRGPKRHAFSLPPTFFFFSFANKPRLTLSSSSPARNEQAGNAANHEC
jgi:hypothetical protein